MILLPGVWSIHRRADRRYPMPSVKMTTLVGGLLGTFLGLGSGVAFGGDAINGVYVFGPIGALIGWLTGIKPSRQTHSTESPTLTIEISPRGHIFGQLVSGALTIAGYIWNMHIDLIDWVGLLDRFVQRPWLFVVTALAVSLVFPPFLVFYFVIWVCAAQLGLEEERSFRVDMKSR